MAHLGFYLFLSHAVQPKGSYLTSLSLKFLFYKGARTFPSLQRYTVGCSWAPVLSTQQSPISYLATSLSMRVQRGWVG